MKSRRIQRGLLVSAWALLVLPVAAISETQANAPAEVRLELFPARPAQTIEGFGASGAWWAQAIGAWPREKRTQIVELLFGETGIGLTIYRYNLGAGSGPEIRDPWRRAETFETAPGTYDWSRDANAVRILREACALGARRVVLFANSPPLRMTRSGYAFARDQTGLSNLRPEMYEAFARYLVDIAEHFAREMDLPVHSISPLNEPQWEWNGSSQEGCHYEPNEAAHLVGLVVKQVRERALDVEVEALESASWERRDGRAGEDPRRSTVYVDTLLANSFVRAHLDGYALHSYWAELEQKRTFARYFFATYPEKKLHMTEWCEMKGGRDYGMDSALTLAGEIIDDLIVGSVSSWQYWIAVSKYNFRDGLIYVDETAQSIAPTKRLWAMGQFSRFIRPGFQRIEAHCNATRLRLVAAKDPCVGTVVVVVSNPDAREVSATLRLAGDTAQRQYDSWETSRHKDLQQSAENRSDARYTFPARSVTTLRFRL